MCFQSQDSRSVSHLVTVLAIVAGDWYQCSLASSTGQIFFGHPILSQKKKKPIQEKDPSGKEPRKSRA